MTNDPRLLTTFFPTTGTLFPTSGTQVLKSS